MLSAFNTAFSLMKSRAELLYPSAIIGGEGGAALFMMQGHSMLTFKMLPALCTKPKIMAQTLYSRCHICLTLWVIALELIADVHVLGGIEKQVRKDLNVVVADVLDVVPFGCGQAETICLLPL